MQIFNGAPFRYLYGVYVRDDHRDACVFRIRGAHRDVCDDRHVFHAHDGRRGGLLYGPRQHLYGRDDRHVYYDAFRAHGDHHVHGDHRAFHVHGGHRAFHDHDDYRDVRGHDDHRDVLVHDVLPSQDHAYALRAQIRYL